MKVSQTLSALALVLAWNSLLPSCQAFQSSSVTTTPHRPHPFRESSMIRLPQATTTTRKKTSSSTTSTELQAAFSPLTALASSPLGAVTVLAGVVLVHEAGHYLAARSFNISVEEFSVGFGPKLLGFKALGNEFNLRGLPLGGYVRFPENYDIQRLQELEGEAREAFEQRRQEEGWTQTQNAFNILSFGLWDDRRRKQQKLLETQQQQQAAEEATQRPWWQKIIAGNNNVAMESKPDPEKFEMEYYDDPNLLQNRPWFERAVVLSGGVVFNMILAFSIYFGAIGVGGGLPQPVFDSGVVITQAPMGASAGILQRGDIILGINGNQLMMASNGPAAVRASKQVGDVVSTVLQTPDGESVSLKVQRGKDQQPMDILVQPRRAAPSGPQTIGVLLSPNFKEIQKIQSNDLAEAAQLAFKYFSEIFSQTLNGLLSLLSMLVTGKGLPPGQSVSGPIGLIRTGTEVISTQDLTAVFMFAAALSVNLGVVNALPLPALDGGQLAFVIAEAITGRKVDQRFQEGITSVAILFLLLISVSTAFSDVGSILSGK